MLYFMALGGCPMCQEMHKILTAIFSPHYSWPINTLISHLKHGIKPSMLNMENELITWFFQLQFNNCFSPQDNQESEKIAHASEDDNIITGLV